MMIQNRSAPPGTMTPVLTYQDVPKAIAWLCGAFGFTPRLQTPPDPDGSIHHAQLAFGMGGVILTTAAAAPGDSVLVRVQDIDAHCERARRFGAKIVMEPGTKEFGERQYGAEDFAGRRWTFTESMADMAPEDWGGQTKEIVSTLVLLPRPRVCYLQIPAKDARQSAAFYQKVLGWSIRGIDSDHPSFDDATGYVSGGFFTNLAPMREAGIIVSIWVNGIQEVLERAVAGGGEAVEKPHPDHPGGTSLIATFRDPAGNLIGLYEEPL